MGRFATDTAPPASAVSNTPAGGIAATDVQAAVNELDSEKLSASGQALSVSDQGTQSSGTFTPEPSDGHLQKAANNGAHTLAAMSETGGYRLVYSNGASAGTIIMSGFDDVDDPDTALAHTTQNSVIEIVAFNDGVAKVATVRLIVDAS